MLYCFVVRIDNSVFRNIPKKRNMQSEFNHIPEHYFYIHLPKGTGRINTSTLYNKTPPAGDASVKEQLYYCS